MLDDIDKQMIFNFLQTNYPVTRVKYNMRFKRGITLDNGRDYIFNDKIQFLEIKFHLITTIMTVFDCNDAIAKSIVVNYLDYKDTN